MFNESVVLVKDLPNEERPREKLLRFGAAAMSDVELLAILLRTGSRQESVIKLAERLLVMYREQGLGGLARLEPRQFARLKGIGMVKAVTIAAALELGKRLAERPGQDKKTIDSPQAAADYVMARLRDETREHFLAMLLDTRHHVLDMPVISIGNLNSSVVHPREVFKQAVLASAASIILLHNHPSGDPKPSREDINITSNMVRAGQIIGITVLDHIIIGDNQYISMKETGLIET